MSTSSPIDIQDLFATKREELIAALRQGEAETVRGILQLAVEQYPAYAATVTQLINTSVTYAIIIVGWIDMEIANAIRQNQETFALVQQLMKENQG